MRTGRNQKKIAHLLLVLTQHKQHHLWLSAASIAIAADMSHEAVLAWLYALRDADLVECQNVNPRLWRWKQ